MFRVSVIEEPAPGCAQIWTLPIRIPPHHPCVLNMDRTDLTQAHFLFQDINEIFKK